MLERGTAGSATILLSRSRLGAKTLPFGLATEAMLQRAPNRGSASRMDQCELFGENVYKPHIITIGYEISTLPVATQG